MGEIAQQTFAVPSAAWNTMKNLSFKCYEHFAYGWVDYRSMMPSSILPKAGEVLWRTEAKSRGYCMLLYRENYNFNGSKLFVDNLHG